MSETIEHKGKVKGFGTNVTRDDSSMYILLEGKGEVYLPKDTEVKIEWMKGK